MHRSLMTLPVALLAAAVIATPAWAGGDDGDDPTPTPAPTEVPTVAPVPTETPAPVLPAPPAPPLPPVATPAPVPQVVPVVRERSPKAPRHKRVVHHKRAPKRIRLTPKPVAVLAAQVAATPVGGVQAGEGGTAREDGGLPLGGLIGGGFLLLLAGGAAARAGVRH